MVCFIHTDFPITHVGDALRNATKQFITLANTGHHQIQLAKMPGKP